jgi:hypothetical protein
MIDSSPLQDADIAHFFLVQLECGYSKRMAELCNIVGAMNISGQEAAFKYE